MPPKLKDLNNHTPFGHNGQWCFTMAGLPKDAYPQSVRKGKYSFTVGSPHTGAKIEVLLKQKAFRIVKQGMINGTWATKTILFGLAYNILFSHMFPNKWWPYRDMYGATNWMALRWAGQGKADMCPEALARQYSQCMDVGQRWERVVWKVSSFFRGSKMFTAWFCIQVGCWLAIK